MSYKRLYANNAKTTLASPITSADSAIILADTSKFPVPGENEFFSITIDAGSSIEIVYAYGVNGNVLSPCTRGMEGTSAQSFLSGTRVENRVTAGALSSFSRLIDRVADIDSVDSLDRPSISPANSYLCASPDDDGAPVLAVKNGDFWRFANYPTTVGNYSALSNGTTNSTPLSGANAIAPISTVGSHIIVFTTGNNKGLARRITSTTDSTVSWATPLPYAVNIGDHFNIYVSNVYTLNYLKSSSDDGLIYSILFGE